MLNLFQPHELSAARQSVGLTIAELARRSGVSRDTIERIEAGRANPTVSTLRSLSEALAQ
jgi:predicted transcriptional regulator